MTANRPASRRSLKSDLARVDAQVVTKGEYEELPELTEEMLARAKVNNGGRPAYRPVSHDHDAFLDKARSRKGFTAEYESLELEYQVASQMLKARSRVGLTQDVVAGPSTDGAAPRKLQ